MNRAIIVLIALASLATAAKAEPAQKPDPVWLQQVITSLQAQRNDALDRAALAEAQTKMTQIEVEKLRARVKEPEKPPER